MIRLNNRLSLCLPASGASHNLREQRERALSRAVILRKQRLIRVHNTDQRHAVKIQSFGDHLCAKQNIRLVFRKRFQQLRMRAFGACRIRIHAENFSLRKHLLQFCLQPLCAGALPFEVRAAAVRAGAPDGNALAAIVTHEAVIDGMIRHRNTARRTRWRPAARWACDLFGSTAPI